uniref:Inter-alpha-trypsin inhibitor heavy chain family, member 4 n=1 Tax=Nothobranchius furzeri TaxID=105023 RepID=A0A1A8UU74_NOTFU
MRKAVLQLTLLGLLLTLAASQPNKDDWDIRSFHINSTVTSRYATTIITSRVTNSMDESKEIEFHVQIPKNAFISRFRMFIDGQVYDGVVKTKEQAQQQYTQAVSRGQSAGIVSSVGRTMEEFKTSVTVAAHKKVTFELTYEELLKRTLGKYELQIHARPMQPVADFKVDVYIYEKAGISYIDVKGGLSTKALANAITKTHADKQAWVHFYPTVDHQKTCDSCGEQGMNGDLVIVYDVKRDDGLGDIKTSEGYFVHHFAPSNLTRIPKNIVFLIDQSGSMHGKKIEQTRTALLHILNDLAEDDFFGLITFDSSISQWKRELVQATSENLEEAKVFARNIPASGGTNINDAVLEGAHMLNAHPREGSASILILLTDGDPTSGETNPEIIQSNARRAIAEKFPLYCLGFGFDVKFEFLEKMSLENNGVARRIYEDSDADLQLQGFYEEVATPLLTDVTMIYLGGTNLTKTNFSQYYNGSEIVVAGQITDNNIETFIPEVVAISSNRKVTFSNTNTSVEPSTETVAEGLLQRVWAYLKVKQLLEKEVLLSGPEKEKVKKETLELSLKYSFVTPLTSMVVTKPQENKTEVLHKPKEGKRQRGYDISFKHSHGRGRHHSLLLNSNRPVLQKNGHVTRNRPVKSKHISPPLNEDYSLSYASLPRDFKIIRYESLRPSTRLLAKHPPPATSAPLTHRFLLKTENLSLPLCFDITGPAILKLLYYPTRVLHINGELDSETNGGFTKIAIHVTADHHIEVETEMVTVQKGQAVTRYAGQEIISYGSVNVQRSNREINVTVDDMLLRILVHVKNGHKFLWPVLVRWPLVSSAEGISALKPVDYEEAHQQQTKLIINHKNVHVTRSSAHDYSFSSPLELNCWLSSPDDALQRPHQDFFTAQI